MDAMQLTQDLTGAQSPPAAPQPLADDPLTQVRQRLHALADELMRGRNRKLLIEYLTLRRALR
jgi:hypothetical protein